MNERTGPPLRVSIARPYTRRRFIVECSVLIVNELGDPYLLLGSQPPYAEQIITYVAYDLRGVFDLMY